MAIRHRSRNPHPQANRPREPDPVREPPPGDNANRPRKQIGVKTVIAIIIVLPIVCGGCIWIYKDKQYKHEKEIEEKKLSLEEKRMAHEVEMTQYKNEKEIKEKKNEAELQLKEKLLLEEKRIAHVEEMHRIEIVSEREVDMEKYKLDVEKEMALAKMKLEKEKDVEKQKLKDDKAIKDKELELGHLEELERMHLLSEKELEKKLEIDRLQIEQVLEEKKIEATRDVYMKSFEAKKVVKKDSYFFGLFSTEREEIESPLKDGHMLHIVQEALKPQLTQGKRRNNSGRSDVIDEDL